MSWFKSISRALNAHGVRPPPDELLKGLESFTPRAQQALSLSTNEAARLNYNYVGTEHLLLGLIRLRQGTAIAVLKKMGLDLETVRLELDKQVGQGPCQNLSDPIPY